MPSAERVVTRRGGCSSSERLRALPARDASGWSSAAGSRATRRAEGGGRLGARAPAAVDAVGARRAAAARAKVAAAARVPRPLRPRPRASSTGSSRPTSREAVGGTRPAHARGRGRLSRSATGSVPRRRPGVALHRGDRGADAGRLRGLRGSTRIEIRVDPANAASAGDAAQARLRRGGRRLRGVFHGRARDAAADAGVHSRCRRGFGREPRAARSSSPGATLFLPMPVDGALFSAGDCHARQGDGEVSSTCDRVPARACRR